MQKKIRMLVEDKRFQCAILGVICFNAILFALQTFPAVMKRYGEALNGLDQLCLAVFVIELFLKIYAYRARFFRDAWNVFDFLVVAVSFVPDCGMFSAVRLFRVLRVFKLISGVRQMRIILDAIVRSIPGIGWAGGILLLIYFVYGILGTNLFGRDFPDWFGSLWASVYSLFQVMTLESWSMGIARPVIAVHPFAWVYFISYILLTTFVIMNIVVGIVLNSIAESSKAKAEVAQGNGNALDEALSALAQAKAQLESAEAALNAARKQGNGHCA